MMKNMFILLIVVVVLGWPCHAAIAADVDELTQAAQKGDLKTVKILVHQGYDVNQHDEDGWTPLSEAVSEGHTDVVKFLLHNEAKFKQRCFNLTPLHRAADRGHIDIARLLIQAGADVNAHSSFQLTPLHMASFCGNTSVAEVLLSNGAEVNAKDSNGETSLHNAAKESDAIVNLLLDYGAEINVQDEDGITPLHIASQRNQIDIIRVLMKNGGDPELQDKEGNKPLDMEGYREFKKYEIFMEGNPGQEEIAFFQAKRVVENRISQLNMNPFKPNGKISQIKPVKSRWPTNYSRKTTENKKLDFGEYILRFPSKYKVELNRTRHKMLADGIDKVLFHDSVAADISLELPPEITTHFLGEKVEKEYLKYAQKSFFEKILAIYTADAKKLSKSVPFEKRILNLYLLSLKAIILNPGSDENFKLFSLKDRNIILASPGKPEKGDRRIVFYSDFFAKEYPSFGLSIMFSNENTGNLEEAKAKVYSFFENFSVEKRMTEQVSSPYD